VPETGRQPDAQGGDSFLPWGTVLGHPPICVGVRRSHMTPKALVLGGNFAGVTAALSLKRELGADVDVTVVSKSTRFTFNPSFIWISFGKRTARDVSVPIAPTFERHGELPLDPRR
jgi:hypothetical protein